MDSVARRAILEQAYGLASLLPSLFMGGLEVGTGIEPV